MRNCEMCESDDEHIFQVIMSGEIHQFDSFACAIRALAPRCYRCGRIILGRGVEDSGAIFCGAHCSHIGGFFNVVNQDSVRSYL
jgi:hypothetical protein